jgi:type I restriction enzyme, S subunit
MTWPERRVREMATLVNGFPFDSEDFSATGEVALVRIRDILSEQFGTFVPEGVVPREAWVRDGDVVIGMDGDFNCVLWRRGPAALNQRVCLLRANGASDSRFLAYALPEHLRRINDLTYSTTVKHLSSGQVKAIRLVAPNLQDQERIADYLDRETGKVDALIREQRGLVDVLRERRIALICRAVTKGLNGSAGLVNSGSDWLGDVPSHWELKRLKFSVDSTQVGVWGAEPTGGEDDVLCVRVADFDRARLRVSEEVPTVRSVRESDRRPRLLQPGDLLLEKSGGTAINPVGFVGIFDGAPLPAVSSNFLTRLRVADGQHPRYWLYAHAASYSTRLTARSVNQTTGIQNLDQSAYFDEVFPFPPSDEQRSIAEYLDEQVEKIDVLVAEAEGIVAVAKERRSALITAAVTGQIDVRGEVF